MLAGPRDAEHLALVADMCRFNCLSAVKLAGSGHLGSSFSAMDIVVALYFRVMNTVQAGLTSSDRDVYFSSKGHDVPGLYAVLYAAGLLSQEKLSKLRRLGGVDGHPDVGTPGMEANTGSLGMGISKGKGMAYAKRLLGKGGRVFVMTGDGELQEGQNYEALLTGAMQGADGLTIVVDHNKYQTDLPVSQITDLGDLEARFKSFGWTVLRCDGHDIPALVRTLDEATAVQGGCIVIADTIKGRGVSFMEGARVPGADARYAWHSGAPDDAHFLQGSEELLASVSRRFNALDCGTLAVEALGQIEPAPGGKKAKQFVADAFGEALVRAGERRRDLVVLDGDLAADCRVRTFGERFPDRFIENGIAEQDMVSTAGGMARMGLLPVVNSFGSFLASRANEQIYNNATERTKIIYVCHFGGLIPAGPGKSHQSIRDIALFGTLPGATILAPGTPAETEQALDYLIDTAEGVCMLRLAIGPSPREITLPANHELVPGRGCVLREGTDAVLFAYGPVMLHEALLASEILAERGFGLAVVDHPWVNRVDSGWFAPLTEEYPLVAVLDDHGPRGALGDAAAAALLETGISGGKRFLRLAVDEFPACGAPGEVLAYHGLDGASIADAICGEGAAPSSLAHAGEYTLDAPQ